ncbi:23S rRNA (uracil-C(5))-methyltransferase RlmCD [bioreactor metagenome]|uniref:23S rRNA (Uracil-C(5))-methyltransferase RlmCD n=1 Tax=bioreactor metagenome TaxID=1076179 RepID=A0A644ZEV1_9ZZZZ
MVDVGDCLLQHEAALRLKHALGAWMRRRNVPAYDEQTHTGLVRHLFVRTSAAGQTLCAVVVNGRSLPREDDLADTLRNAELSLVGVVLAVNEARSNVILGETYRALWGQDYLEDTLCGLSFRLSVPSFFQVNRAQTEVLYGLAGAYAQLTGTETLLDLYCGIGTIALSMAGRAGRVIGAEVVPQAVEDARANAERNGILNAEFICADAGEAAQALAARGLRPDVICVDPPRKGLSPGVIAAVAQMAPARLVYVSCDPATLARDVKLLGQHGYLPQEAVAVDLFPRTAHVETCVLLSHKNPQTSPPSL